MKLIVFIKHFLLLAALMLGVALLVTPASASADELERLLTYTINDEQYENGIYKADITLRHNSASAERPTEPRVIRSIYLDTAVSPDNFGYETLKKRPQGVEKLKHNCPEVLVRDSSCQIEVEIDMSQQATETDIVYWRRLQSYENQNSLKIEIDTADAPQVYLPWYYNLFGEFSKLKADAANRVIWDKCKWVNEEPWLYETILLGYNGNLEQRKQAAGCIEVKPPKLAKPGLVIVTHAPGKSDPGRYTIFPSEIIHHVDWRYMDIRVTPQEARKVFWWVSYDQIKSSGTKYMDEESKKIFFEDIHSVQSQYGATTRYRCRLRLYKDGIRVLRDWFICKPGLRFNLPTLTSERHYYELMVQPGNDAGWGGTTIVNWQPLDRSKCLISDARSRFFIFRGKNNPHVRLVTRYKASKPGKVRVTYFARTKQGKTGKRLGVLTARFAGTTGKYSKGSRNGYKILRVKQRRSHALMRKLRSQKTGFIARMQVLNAPGYCRQFYKIDVELSVLRRFFRQFTWFQKGSFPRNSSNSRSVHK